MLETKDCSSGSDLQSKNVELIKRLEFNDGLISKENSKETHVTHQKNLLNNKTVPTPPPMGPLLNSEGLILPRKPVNPYLVNPERQDLRREILFSQKTGRSVLNKKSELQRAFEKHKDHQTSKELEIERNQNKSLLERVIEERARRLENLEKKEEPSEKMTEFMKIHAKVCCTRDGK